MKGFRIKKKDRITPVHIVEIQKQKDRCVPPKFFIKNVHVIPRSRSEFILRLEDRPV